jgi:hypothetical protein
LIFDIIEAPRTGKYSSYTFHVAAASYEFNDDLYYDYQDNSLDGGSTGDPAAALPPTFLSAPQDILLNEGSRLRLPCRVDRLQGFVLLWKKGGHIIALGSSIIAEVIRLRRVSCLPRF